MITARSAATMTRFDAVSFGVPVERLRELLSPPASAASALGTHDGRSVTDTAGATGPSASKLSRAILSMAFSRWFCTIQTPVSTSLT
jgi:hypothetical protein